MSIGRIAAGRQRPAARALLGHRAAAARDARRAGRGRDPALGPGDHRRGEGARRNRDAVMIKLSVNVNKVATHPQLARRHACRRCSRRRSVCVAAGAPGITVHPRADARHITAADVREIAVAAARRSARDVEYNIEGDPRPDLLALVHEVKPTSARWCRCGPARSPARPAGRPTRRATSLDRRRAGSAERGRPRQPVRRSGGGADPLGGGCRRRSGRAVHRAVRPRVRAGQRQRPTRRFATYAHAAELAHSLGLGVNAGHDLDLDNLVLFRALPHLDEVSIGHALISHALFVGLDRSVRDYLDVLAGRPEGPGSDGRWW